MKAHRLTLTLCVAALLAVALAGCAMLPQHQDALDQADAARDALVELHEQAPDAETRALIEMELAELRKVRREILAQDAQERTSAGLGALDVILGLVGAGGLGGLLSRLGPSRGKETLDRVQQGTDELWDRLAQAEAVIAELRGWVHAPPAGPAAPRPPGPPSPPTPLNPEA